MDENLKKSKIEEYEIFIEEKLKKDLSEIEAILENKYESYLNWANVKSLLEGLKIQQKEDKDYDITLDLDCNVFAHGRVEDENIIFINIGCNCYLPMDYEEADKYSDIRINVLNKEMKHYRKLAVEVKMNIKLFLLAIEELGSKRESN